MTPTEVFLSHATADREEVSGLAETIRAHGVPVWYSRTNLVGAQQWHDEIGDALARADWFAVALSSSAVESMWVKREVVYALSQRRFQDRIVPLLLEDCEVSSLSWALPAIQYVDFRDSRKEALRELMRVWGVAYRGS